MARTKRTNIASLTKKVLSSDGVTTLQVERREAVKDDKGNVVSGQWNRTIVDVPAVTSAAGIIVIQEHITKNGPEGYDGNDWLMALVNTQLARGTIGEELSLAPSPNYVDPAEAAAKNVQKLAVGLKPGVKLTAEQILAQYREAGLVD